MTVAPPPTPTASGFSFLRSRHARRMRDSFALPFMPVVEGETPDEELEHDLPNDPRPLPKTQRDYELAPDEWQPIRVSDCGSCRDLEGWALRPRRFVDGKDVGRTVAWLQDEKGFPIPVRLSILGAIAVENEGGALKRRAHHVELALTMATGCFDLEGIEDFRAALGREKITLNSVPCPPEGAGFEWERTAGRTRAESRRRMIELERAVMGLGEGVPTIVDGRLDVHLTNEEAYATAPVVGLVKSHHVQYFENASGPWRALYDLEPGERTPCFVISNRQSSRDVVSWYVRLCGSNGEMPNSGVVRAEVARAFFEGHCGFEDLDKWSRLACEYRCRDESYARSSVSIHPIVRGEEMLGAAFPPLEKIVATFYRRFEL
jgi:hypothetical protein